MISKKKVGGVTEMRMPVGHREEMGGDVVMG